VRSLRDSVLFDGFLRRVLFVCVGEYLIVRACGYGGSWTVLGALRRPVQSRILLHGLLGYLGRGARLTGCGRSGVAVGGLRDLLPRGAYWGVNRAGSRASPQGGCPRTSRVLASRLAYFFRFVLRVSLSSIGVKGRLLRSPARWVVRVRLHSWVVQADTASYVTSLSYLPWF
jgi:hypothetical protein